MKISILCTDQLHPVVKRLHEWVKHMSDYGHIVSLFFDKSELPGGDILFLVSCSQIIFDAEREKYKSTLVLHASDLPKGRGWSPHVWAILNGEDNIVVSLLEATEPVDSGALWLKTSFSLQGHELLDEINTKLFDAELHLMTEAVNGFSVIKPTIQEGYFGEYMKKRSPIDSRLDPKKSILEQFNLLRVVDSARYPAFFDYQGHRYIIKIEKDKCE